MKKTILTSSIVTMLFFNCLAINAAEVQTEHHPIVTINTTKEISSFCKAIVQGDLETVKKLIDLGEDVNKKSLGMTPAHFAARYNKPEILQVLINNGANLKTKCDKGFTVKKYAELSSADAALEVLKNAMNK